MAIGPMVHYGGGSGPNYIFPPSILKDLNGMLWVLGIVGQLQVTCYHGPMRDLYYLYKCITHSIFIHDSNFQFYLLHLQFAKA